MRKPHVVDAKVDYVAGPMRPGDEHPGRRGWFFTGQRDQNGVLLWYRPPGRVSLAIKRAALTIYVLLIAVGVLGGLYAGI